MNIRERLYRLCVPFPFWIASWLCKHCDYSYDWYLGRCNKARNWMIVNPYFVACITVSQTCSKKREKNHQPTAYWVQVITSLIVGSQIARRHNLHQPADSKRDPHYNAMNIYRNKLYLYDFVSHFTIPWVCLLLFGLVMRLHLLSKCDLNSIMIVCPVVQQLISLEIPCVANRHWRVEINNESILRIKTPSWLKVDESINFSWECGVPFI